MSELHTAVVVTRTNRVRGTVIVVLEHDRDGRPDLATIAEWRPDSGVTVVVDEDTIVADDLIEAEDMALIGAQDSWDMEVGDGMADWHAELRAEHPPHYFGVK